MPSNTSRGPRAGTLAAAIVGETIGRKTITQAIVRSWGGADKFAADFRREFRTSKPGSPTRARLLTAVLSAILDSNDESPHNFSIDEIEAEFRKLTGDALHAPAKEEPERTDQEVR